MSSGRMRGLGEPILLKHCDSPGIVADSWQSGRQLISASEGLSVMGKTAQVGGRWEGWRKRKPASKPSWREVRSSPSHLATGGSSPALVCADHPPWCMDLVLSYI